MEREEYTYLPSGLARRLEGLHIAVRRPMASLRRSQHRSESLGSAVEFAEYRDYQPGDPLKRLDWSVYARSDRYVVREAYQEVSARCFVLLDSSASMQFGYDGPMGKIEYARYLAAGVMFVMVNQGDSAGLITFDSGVRYFFNAATTPAGLRPHLKHLEDHETGGEGDIEAALHEVTDLIEGPALIVVISDLLQQSRRIIRGLHHLDHDNMDVTVFHLMDPAELTLPMSGLVELEDMEGGGRMTVECEEVRDMYMQQVNRHMDRIRRNCLNMQMDYLFSDTTTPVHEFILKRSF